MTMHLYIYIHLLTSSFIASDIHSIFDVVIVVDKDNAWNNLLVSSGFGIGNSRSNSLYWAASRPAALSGWDGAPKAADTTVKQSCTSNSACDAMGT